MWSQANTLGGSEEAEFFQLSLFGIGGKYQTKRGKKMTANKGAINNSQMQGCCDTSKIGKASEGL